MPEAPLLEITGLDAGYGRKQVVFGARLAAARGQIVTVLGHNGAGKTTTVKTALGILPAMGGRIVFDGREIGSRSTAENVRAGMALAPSERFVYAPLSVADNLLIGGMRATRDEVAERRDEVHALFPILAERHAQLAGTLSGGQQRMLSLAMLLMAAPRLIILDEPSLGLAPVFVETIFDALRRLADERGIAVVLLEQNVRQALRVADHAFVMRGGHTILDEPAAALRERPSYWDLF